jgi:hypothetical protein
VPLDPRTGTVPLDPRTVPLDPRTVLLDPRTVLLDPRTVLLDPRTVLLDPETIYCGSALKTKKNFAAATDPESGIFILTPRYNSNCVKSSKFRITDPRILISPKKFDYTEHRLQ